MDEKQAANAVGSDYRDLFAQKGYLSVASFNDALARNAVAGAVYRGHANETWTLTASALRPGANGITTARQLVGWRAAASRFVQPRPSNDFEWLALAQHHGIPTTLLDWTYNPLVALFFACGEPNHVNGAVWQVGPSSFRTFEKPESVAAFKQERDQPGLVNASSMNARSVAQDSALSIHPAGGAFTPSEPAAGVMFSVPARDKISIRRALASFGISEDRLFVDLAVVVKSFRSRLAIDRLTELGRQAQAASKTTSE